MSISTSSARTPSVSVQVSPCPTATSWNGLGILRQTPPQPHPHRHHPTPLPRREIAVNRQEGKSRNCSLPSSPCFCASSVASLRLESLSVEPLQRGCFKMLFLA